MPRGYKSRAARRDAALELIRSAVMEIESLQEEMANWRDGLEGTNLEGSEKFERIETAAYELEMGHDALDNAISDLESVEFPTMFG